MGRSESDPSFDSHGTAIGKGEGALGNVTEWILVQGDRPFVALGLSAATFVMFLTLNQLGIIAFVNDDSITRLAGGMIAGTFSLVTLVVSINQLILSQEFAAAGSAREQLEGVMEFRRDIETKAEVSASPAAPTRVLELLVEMINHRVSDLASSIDDHDDEAGERIQKYANGVQQSTDRVDETLEQAEFGSFDAVSAAIEYDNAWQLYAARSLRGTHADSLSEESLEAFDDVIDGLELFDIAVEHFKTTYLQRELTRFSQLTIYTGVPAILGAMVIGFLYADFGGPAISATYLPIVVSALLAVVVSPLSLLVAYILRTATVTRRTASTGPMLPQKDPDAGPFDVSYDDG